MNSHKAIKLKNYIQWFTRTLCSICNFILIPLMLLTTVDVISRAFFSQPVPGGVELSSYILAVFILAGMAYTHQVNGNVYVEFFIVKLPTRLRYAVDTLTTLLSLFVIILITWQGTIEAMQNTRVSDMLRIPRWPFMSLVPVAGFLLCLELSIDLVQNIFKTLRKETDA